MQKIGNLADWEHLQKDEFISVPKTPSRRASIICNSSDPVALYYYPLTKKGQPDKNKAAVFLAKVHGREEIQFRTSIPIALVCDGPIAIQTNQGMQLHTYSASKTFTKVVERRAATQDMEAVMYRARLNEIARQNAHKEMIAKMQQMEAKLNAYEAPNDDSSTGTATNVEPTSAPQSDPNGWASTETPPTGGEGNDPQANE